MSEFNFIETPNTSAKVIDTITLTTNAYLSFPTFFANKHKLKSGDGDLLARLFYDKQRNAIAIQFTNNPSEGLYKMNVSDKYGATCKVKSFLLNNEIDIKKNAGKYEYSKYSAEALGVEGEDLFVILLDKKESVE